ncbi:MAG: UDP-N-acetylglucosamine 3-dehydrogenase [Methanosarcinales archaeon]
MRVGIIGVGMMGQNHARIYSEMKGIELVGVSDINKDRVKEIAQYYHTTPYTNHIELLKQDLDAVSIVVPTTLHKTIALDVIEYGTNLFVEKPIADTPENADAIIEAANNAGLKLMVGHIERFNPAVIKLKEIIEKGLLGKIVSISARRVGPFNPRIRDVGIIIDLGVHDIDVMSYLYNKKVSKVYAVAGNGRHPFEDRASIILYLDDGCAGMIETNWLTPHKVRKLNVVGMEGVAYLDYLEQSLELYSEKCTKKVKIEKKEPLKNELEHFIEVVSNGNQPLVKGEDGKRALQIAMFAIKSYKYGKIIEIKN